VFCGKFALEVLNYSTKSEKDSPKSGAIEKNLFYRELKSNVSNW